MYKPTQSRVFLWDPMFGLPVMNTIVFIGPYLLRYSFDKYQGMHQVPVPNLKVCAFLLFVNIIGCFFALKYTERVEIPENGNVYYALCNTESFVTLLLEKRTSSS